MAAKTDVYRVVYVGQDGNQNALVFQEPVEGKSYHANQMFSLPGGNAVTPNDEGDIPHRELADGADQLELGEYTAGYGLTWHFAK